MQALRGGFTTLSSKTSGIAARPYNFQRVFGISFQSHSYIHGPRNIGFAAALPSNSSQPQRRRSGRVSRDERKAMVEAFVDKYRALNAGKYPSPSVTQKQVGGSYYVVKNILQELVHNSKRTTSKNDEIPVEEVPKEECLVSAEATNVSSSKANINLTYSPQILGRNNESQTIVISHMEQDVLSHDRFAAKQEVLGSTEMPSFEDTIKLKTTGDHSRSDETHIAQSNQESKEVSYLCTQVPEDVKNYRVTSDGSVLSNESKLELEAGQDAFESNKLEIGSKNKAATSDDSVGLDEQKIVLKAGQEASDKDKLESKDVSDLCIEIPGNSKKAASSDDFIDLKEPMVVMEATEKAFESEKFESKKASQLCAEDPENHQEAVFDCFPESTKTTVVLEAGQDVSQSDNLERDVSRMKMQEKEPPNRSTVWGNLRSFAQGVINFWRKM